MRSSCAADDAPVDVVLHPRRSVIDLEFAALEREVAPVFRAIQAALDKDGSRGIQAAGAGGLLKMHAGQ